MTRKQFNVLLLLAMLSGVVFLHFLFADNSRLLLVQSGIVLALAIVLFSVYTKISLQMFLILIAILPFVYINRGFSRPYLSIIVQDIPLFTLTFFSILIWLKKTKSLKIKIDYLFLPIVIYLIFSVWLAIYGFLQGYNKTIVSIELYQAFYFVLVFPIYYLLKKERDYLIVISVLSFVFLVVAVEYIVLNSISILRVTTYHNHIFPIFVSILFAGVLFLENKSLKFLFTLLLLLFWFGSFATGTRTLLVANLLSMIIVLLFFLKSKGKDIKYILIGFAVVLLLIMPRVYSSVKSNTEIKHVSGEERVESIMNPLEDISLLMRVEAVYHMTNQIIKKPFIGYGFGHMLQMKYLLQTAFIFPDNNYLYYWLKGGIFYLLVVLWMFFRLLKVIYNLFSFTNSRNVKMLMAGFFAGIVGVMLFAMLNANLVKLRLNFIYVIIFAFINYEYNRYLRNDKIG